MTTPTLKVYPPPQWNSGDLWRRWLTDVVWPLVGAGVGNSGPQGTFPKLQIGSTTIAPIGTPQAGVILDQALLVEFTDTRNAILYGVVSALTGAGSNGQVVAAQLNGTAAPASGISAVWGSALEATAYPNTTCNLVGIEPATVNLNDAAFTPKWGMNPVFKNRTDGATAAFNGLGSNAYNYFAIALAITAQGRSSSAEFCGWNVGIQFLDGSLDASTVPAWNNATSYQPGQIVSNGGVTWKAIVSNTNVAPAVGVTWVQYSVGGISGSAVGIDFSCLSTTSMGRMASALRLRSSMYFHWEETGAVGTKFDAGTSLLHLVDNAGTFRFGIDVTNGLMKTSLPVTSLGGGVAPTLGTIGGSGPATAAQDSWGQLNYNGTNYFIPLWK